MFLPIGDYPNPARTQWVTRLLLIGNIAIHLSIGLPLSAKPATYEDYVRDGRVREALGQKYTNSGTDMPVRMWIAKYKPTHYDVFVYHWGFKPGQPSLIALLTCMFLHGGLMHLFGNMLYLWIYGDNVEHRLGPIGYLVAYLATGAAATAGFAFMHPDSMTPLVGASGAISGVLGMYLIWFPKNLIRVMIFLLYFPYFFLIRAYWVIGAYFIVDNLLPLLANRAGAVAIEAHIAGFGAGVAVAVAGHLFFGWTAAAEPIMQPGREPRHWHPRGGGRRHARSAGYPGAPAAGYHDPGMDFRRAIRDHRMPDAARAFAELLRGGGLAPESIDVYRLGRWLADAGHLRDARAVLTYYIKHYPNGAEIDAAHDTLGRL